MSESLPGYDEWKTHDPRDDEPEEPPLEEDPDDARDRMIEDERLRDEFGEPDDTLADRIDSARTQDEHNFIVGDE